MPSAAATLPVTGKPHDAERKRSKSPSVNESLVKRVFNTLEPVLQHQGFEYTFIFCFALLNLIIFFVGAFPAWHRLGDDILAMRLSSALARGGGAVLNLNAVLILLVASRSLMTLLRTTPLNLVVPFDKAMPAFHTLVGNVLTVATLVHGIPHFVRYSIRYLWSPGMFGRTSIFISGCILALIMLGMRFSSLISVRRRSFETFHVVHHIGFALFFILIILHGSHNGALKTWMYVILPLCIYIIDRLSRLMKEQGTQLSISRDSANAKESDVVCLRIPRTFSFLAGQYCDIKVPLVSNYQWHPFTIASSPHENEMLFYIKVNGDWTRKLHALFKQRDADSGDIHIHVRGPYGAPAQHVGQYEHVVLISGGVGATPFCSITKYAHHYILNFTSRGAAASASVSAAFSRNQSLHGTPSLGTATPTPRASSGFPSTSHRSHNTSRRMSRNASANFSHIPSRNMSRTASRNMSRSASRTASRPISRSGSGKLERFNSIRNSDSVRSMSRSASYNADRLAMGRPLSMQKLRTTSGCIDRLHSPALMDRASSGRTNDSVGIIVKEQRMHQPNGPKSTQDVPPPMPDFVGPVVPEIMTSPQQSLDTIPRSRFDIRIDLDEDNEFTRPDDYDEELGNPELPIPDRWAVSMDSPSMSQNRDSAGFEVINHGYNHGFDPNRGMFDIDEQHVEEEVEASVSRDALLRELPLEEEEDGVEIEDQILRETTPSNAYNMLGMSFDPQAIMRHLPDGRNLRSSLMKTSMNMMEDATDASVWQDRLLFYLHAVTINWVLLWVMMIRFSLVFIGLIVGKFSFSQKGLGIFAATAFNVSDLVLGIMVTLPILIAIIMEIYVHSFLTFLSDHIANSFDMFVLLPLLTFCIVVHGLNLAGIGDNVLHVSKLLVCVVWPVLSLFIIWRIARTIGSRIVLAPSGRSSHAQTKSLDYIWVSKTSDEDAWLVEELLSLAESNIVRLHRFITRHGPKTEPWMLDYEKVPLKTTYSRPDWNDVFGSLVERSKSGAVIGVFFCGPDSMARMIKQAAMKAMAKSMANAVQRGFHSRRANASSLRGADFAANTSMDANVASNRGFGSTRSLDGARGISGRVASARGPPGQSQEAVSNVAYGCNVKFVIRIENFT